MSDEDLVSFSSQVATKTALSVDQLISTNRPPCMMERIAYRREHKTSTDLCSVYKDQISTTEIVVGRYSALIEKDVDTVRLSLRLQWRNAEGCWTSTLDSRIQTAFYNRLGRSSVVEWLRKSPIPGYDVTFIFTAGLEVDSIRNFLTNVIPAWRTVTRQIRVRQMIANRRCANTLFKDIRLFSHRKTSSTKTAPALVCTPSRSPARQPGGADCWSVKTDACDIRSIAEIEDLIKEIENDSNLINFDIEE
jgi:hypothetical protein